MAQRQKRRSTPAERKKWILGQVEQRGRISFAEIREHFNRSAAQNDLRDLVQEQRLTRTVHGWYEYPAFNEKQRFKGEEKSRIAGYIVQQYCSPGTTLGLDAGSTPGTT